MKRYKVSKPAKLREGGNPYSVPGKGYLGNLIYPIYKPNLYAEPKLSGQQEIGPVPEEDANLEAEKGETAYIPDVDGLAAHYKVAGKKHYDGGTPLNLPDDSFIFSDTQKMKIKDPEILKFFGKTGKEKGGFKPAELATKYDINKYRLILADPHSDDIQRKTAEMMIGNYNLKLGKLALVQESIKGFPQGIPAIALPYLTTAGIDPKDVLPLRHPGETNEISEQEQSEGPHNEQIEQAMGKYGMQISKLMRNGGYTEDGLTSGNQPYHAGPQDWANFGTAAMQEGGVPNNENLFIRPDINTTEYTREPLDSKGSILAPSLVPYINIAKYLHDIFKYIPNNPNNTMIPVGRTPIDSTTIVNKYLKSHPSVSHDTISHEEDLSPEEMKALGIKKYGGTLNEYQEGGTKRKLSPEQYTKLLEIRSKNKISKSTSKQSTSPKDPYSNIKSYKGAKSASKYSDQEWRDFAKQVGFPGGSNADFQRYLWNHPKYGPLVQKLHQEQGMPSAGHYDEGYLGSRYDIIKDTVQQSIPKDEPIKEPTPQENTSLKFKPEVKGEESNPDTGYKISDQGTRQGDSPKWWLQDVIKTAGAASDFSRIKKRLPWAPIISPYIPDPTFYDPTRELAQNTEAMNIGVQGADAFGNPQQYAATFSGIQGAGAKNAADVLAKYNNLNVGVANQFSGMKGDIMNRSNQANAQTAKELYDATTVANQQFDNAKSQARQELRQSYIEAITNRANTQVMNTLYPNYQINPTTGGTMDFYKGSKLKPTSQSSNPYLSAFLEDVKKNPSIDPKLIAQFHGVSGVSKDDPEYFPQGYGKP